MTWHLIGPFFGQKCQISSVNSTFWEVKNETTVLAINYWRVFADTAKKKKNFFSFLFFRLELIPNTIVWYNTFPQTFSLFDTVGKKCASPGPKIFSIFLILYQEKQWSEYFRPDTKSKSKLIIHTKSKNSHSRVNFQLKYSRNYGVRVSPSKLKNRRWYPYGSHGGFKSSI